MSVYLILLFHLIVVSLSSFSVFLSLYIAFVVLALIYLLAWVAFRCLCDYYDCLSCEACREGCFSWRTRIMWLPFVCFFCFLLLFGFLILATSLFLFFVSSISLAGDDALCWLPPCPFSSVSFPLFFLLQTCLKKNLNAPRPSEHPLVRGKNVKTFRWDQ